MYLQNKYLLMKYFIWTMKYFFTIKMYLLTEKHLLTIFFKQNFLIKIFIVDLSAKKILRKISIVGYDMVL